MSFDNAKSGSVTAFIAPAFNRLAGVVANENWLKLWRSGEEGLQLREQLREAQLDSGEQGRLGRHDLTQGIARATRMARPAPFPDVAFSLIGRGRTSTAKLVG